MLRILILLLLSFSGVLAQQFSEKFPESSGLAGFIVTRRFTCPKSLQAVKFPGAFYKESKKKNIFSIAGGKTEESRSCITEKLWREVKADEPCHCKWAEALKFIPLQCDKWIRAGENGVSDKFRKLFYEELRTKFSGDTFYVPDLSFHYFYFKQDSFPQLIAYEFANAKRTVQKYFEWKNGALKYLKNIEGYSVDLRVQKGKLILVNTLDEGISDSLRVRKIYAVAHGTSGLQISDSLTLVSRTGLQLTSYTLDKKFVLPAGSPLYNDAGAEEELARASAGSLGYVLADNGECYFAAVSNNASAIFESEIQTIPFAGKKEYFVLCWIKKIALKP